MGECWSCGAQVGGLRYMFTCPACAETAVLKDIRNGISDGVEGQERAMQMIASGLSNVTDAVTQGTSDIYDELSSISDGLSNISDALSNLAGIVQSGFDELKWELQQQTQVLLSIDQTLKTPSQTQAREWREMAEQLRKRGCFDEAIQWFLKSLEMSPLDFRTYVGLGMTYLRKNDFDKAEEVLKRSFPHAPHSSQFDYKSLSHRLIGRICACRSDYGRAAAELRLAIDLSPEYPEGNYDYTLYCVQSGKTAGWEEPLHRAISARPGYFNVAIVERRFAPARQELEKFLSGLLNEAYKNAGQAIHDAEAKFVEAQSAVANAPGHGSFERKVNEIVAMIATTKSDWVSKDYVKILKVPAGATRAAALSCQLTQETKEWAIEVRQEEERRQQEKERRQKEKEQEEERRQQEALKRMPWIIVRSVILAFVLFIVFSIVGEEDIGGVAGVVSGIIWGVRDLRKLEKKGE